MADERKPSARESFNRFMGLGSYAMGVIILGIMAFSLYDDAGLIKFGRDYQTYAIGLAAALVCFAIGYTTGRKKDS